MRPGVPTTICAPGAQRFELGSVTDTAVDDGDAQPRRLADVFEDGGDLLGQFSRRRQHERLGGVEIRVAALDERQAKSQSLAGTGVGLGNDVLARHEEGYRLVLDRRGVGDALGCKSLYGATA